MAKPDRAEPLLRTYRTQEEFEADAAKLKVEGLVVAGTDWVKPDSGIGRKALAVTTIGVSALAFRKKNVLAVAYVDARIPFPFYSLLHQEALDELRFNLLPDEHVSVIVPGLWDAAIIATERRIFVFKKGMMGGVMGGSKLISWDMDSVHGVQYEFGKQTGFVALQTTNAPVVDMSYWASDSSSPQKAPNAIAINKPLQDRAREGVRDLRNLLLTRKT